MLIDDLMPTFDVSERHKLRVRASADQTFAAIGDVDLSSNWIVRTLLAIRALPARIIGHRAARKFSAGVTLRDAGRFGFFVIAENPPREIVIALQGKFWTVRGGTECATREALDNPIAPGAARGVWNFSIDPDGEGSCVLKTETRVLCADAPARRRFRIYWLFVRPGSGIIRRMMLRTIRNLAESAA
jgi:hypothetical protein